MSLAAQARDAVRAEPFLYDALRAGVVNYRAAARRIDVDGDEESVATALRRYAEELDALRLPSRSVRVRMRRGVGPADDPANSLLAVGGTAIAEGGDGTAILATGEVDAFALERVLGRLRTEGIDVTAAGVADDALVVAVAGGDGPDALRAVEDRLS